MASVGLAQALHKEYKAIKTISRQDHKLIIQNLKPVVYVGKLLSQQNIVYRASVRLAQALHKEYKAIKTISRQDHKLIIQNLKPVVYVGKLLSQHAAIYHTR